MKQWCARLEGGEGLHYLVLALILEVRDPTLTLDKLVQSLVKWRVFELCTHQIIGVQSELVKLLLFIPEKHGYLVDPLLGRLT